MLSNRRQFLMAGATAAASLAPQVPGQAGQRVSKATAFSGKGLGTIFNNDIDNLIYASSGKTITPEEYQRAVYAILDMQPGALAQNVGMPDPVIYPSAVATQYDKYLEEVNKFLSPGEGMREPTQRQVGAMRKLRALGTDPLTLTIEACRQRGVLMLASYRMNAEDFFQGTLLMSDFERGHPEWKIRGANCADPAVPEVYAHRMEIFREVAERYDIDGIEFDFRRWYHMVSDPLKNHPVLTRMVGETRQMLAEVAKKKGCQKLILGVRVGPSLDTDPSPFVYPGCMYYLTSSVDGSGLSSSANGSCKALGLDVKTWIAERLVDYVCPSLFGPQGLPKIREFGELTRNTKVGLYPTLWCLAAWQHGIFDMDKTSPRPISLEQKELELLALYKDDLCANALRMYAEGADGISTFNWYAHLYNAKLPGVGSPDGRGGPGGGGLAVQTYIYPLLKDPAALRRYREEPWAVPPKA